MFEIFYYQKIDETRPAEEYFLSEDIKIQAKIARNLMVLKEFGNTLREPLSKELEDGIFELRTQVGNDISRILYFFVIGKNIILTNGFRKKTEKTPKEELDLAKQYKKDYFERIKQEGDKNEKI